MAALLKTPAKELYNSFIRSITNKAYKSQLAGIPGNRKNATQLRLYLYCKSLAQNKFFENLKYYSIIFYACIANYCAAQTNIKGVVTDNRKHFISDASVYIKGAGDATSTDSSGHFLLATTAKGKQILVASSVGFKETEKETSGCPVLVPPLFGETRAGFSLPKPKRPLYSRESHMKVQRGAIQTIINESSPQLPSPG